MKKQILLLLSMSLFVVIALSAQERGQRGTPEGEKSKKERFVARLELTESQQAQMESLRVTHHKEVAPLKNQLDEKRAALKTLTTSETINQKKIDQTVKEIGALQTNLLQAKTNHKIAMRALLDDKQKMTFDQMEARKGDHQKGPSGPRGK